MKLLAFDVFVKCVVLALAAMIWLGPGSAAAQDAESTVVTRPVSKMPTVHPVPRTLLMTGAGALTAAAGGVGGMILGGAGGLYVDGFDGMITGGRYGAPVGALVLMPVGVVGAGKLMDGNGKWWGLLSGQALGLAPVAAAFVALSPSERESPGFVAAALLLPAFGAALGFELTSDRSAHEAKYGTVTVQPTVAPMKDGMALGLNVSF